VGGRIAVTGASGFIGSHVVRVLQERGDDAVPVRRPFDAATLRDVFANAAAVIHLAGVVAAVRPEEFVAANVEATRVVASAARDAGVPLVHVSSLAAAGPAPASAPRHEDDPPAPLTPYGASKLEGERAVRATSGLTWTIIRPGAVYGPGDRAMLPLFKYARRGILPLAGNPTAAYTFSYVEDLARAIAAAIDGRAAGAAIFAGYNRPVTPRELLVAIRQAVGRRAAIVPIPMAVTRLAAAAGDVTGAVTGRPATLNRWRFAELASPGFVCDVSRMRERLGIVASVDLTRGVQETAGWYRRTGWI